MVFQTDASSGWIDSWGPRAPRPRGYYSVVLQRPRLNKLKNKKVREIFSHPFSAVLFKKPAAFMQLPVCVNRNYGTR
jgi:hypothetical protein